MKETKLHVARIFNFCSQSFSDVTGFTTNPVLQTEWSPVRHRKYLAMTQQSDIPCRENQWEIEHPMSILESVCVFFRSFVHMDTGLDKNNKDFLIVYLLLMWIIAAMNCVNNWKFSCFMQLYCNIFTLTRYSHFYQNWQALNWIKSKPKSIEIKEISHHPL